MTTKKEILDTIKMHCIMCFGGNPEDIRHDLEEVKNCTAKDICLLYPYRLGKDPKPSSARVKVGKHFARSNTKNKR